MDRYVQLRATMCADIPRSCVSCGLALRPTAKIEWRGLVQAGPRIAAAPMNGLFFVGASMIVRSRFTKVG